MSGSIGNVTGGYIGAPNNPSFKLPGAIPQGTGLFADPGMYRASGAPSAPLGAGLSPSSSQINTGFGAVSIPWNVGDTNDPGYQKWLASQGGFGGGDSTGDPIQQYKDYLAWQQYTPEQRNELVNRSATSNPLSDLAHNLPALAGGALLGGAGLVGGATGANLGFNAGAGNPLSNNAGVAAGLDALGGGVALGTAAAGAGAAAGGGGGGAASAGGAAPADLFGGFSVDPATGDVLAPGSNLFGGFSVDPATGDVIGGAAGGGGAAAGGGGSILGGGLTGGGGGVLGGAAAGAGSSIVNRLLGMAPGLAATAYGANHTGINTGNLENVFQQAGANAPLFVQAAVDPLKQAQAQGYGDILQSQGLRNIRGSSFGNQDIANYLTTTNRGIADAGASAAQKALALQGDLAGNIINYQNQNQQQKNNLYGRAGDILGGALSGLGGPLGSGLQNFGNAFGNLFSGPAPIPQLQLPTSIPGSFFDPSMGLL